jgi:hypothetical protein
MVDMQRQQAPAADARPVGGELQQGQAVAAARDRHRQGRARRWVKPMVKGGEGGFQRPGV